MYGLDGLRVRKRMIIENSRQSVRLEHQITVQVESLYFRCAFKTCRGSGNENTSRGREFPSRGSDDCVNGSETRVAVGLKVAGTVVVGTWTGGTGCRVAVSRLHLTLRTLLRTNQRGSFVVERCGEPTIPYSNLVRGHHQKQWGVLTARCS